MIVFYRMCDIPSTSEPPIFANDKFKLNELCLKSFVDVYKDIKPKMVFINDYCMPAYIDMIHRVVPFEFEMHHTRLGINGSCLFQYELFETQLDNFVIFQECDYFHRKPLTEDIIKRFSFVTGYDHPDKYDSEKHPDVQVVDDQHFKHTSSTTSTFATTMEAFHGCREVFLKYGYIDKERWEIINSRYKNLYSALPGITTHMLKDWMSPDIDWKHLWQKYL